MNIREYYITLPILFLFLAISLQSAAQVVVERSKDKAIISGTAYYIHKVKKGETAYSISRAYGISVEELTRENPPALYGINEGQILRIPVIPEAEPEDDVKIKSQRDESLYIYHTLKPGETVYALSRLYGVSENDIISANPGIDINELPVGAEIAVPRREFKTASNEFEEVQRKDRLFHKVVRGESLSSIAEQYGVSLRDLRRENRDIRFPQVGDYLRIPVDTPEEEDIGDMAADSSEMETESYELMTIPSAYTAVKDLRGSMDIAVLLPFYLEENAVRTDIDSSNIVKGKRIYKVLDRSDDWIYPRSIGFVEMYEGILMAADTLRALGLDININAYDIKSDTIELTRLLRNDILSDMDLIIGPVYSHNLAAVASYASRHRIPVVSPVPLMNNSVLDDNPTVFMANSSLEVAQNTIAKRITEYYNDNFVFIHADTTGIDPGIKYFRERILNELSKRLPYEEIKFKEFLFYSRSVFDNDSINRLSQALSEEYGNVIIIASEDASIISESLQDIHTLSRNYEIKVFGYPAMRGIDNLDPRYLFELNIFMYSPYWIDYSRDDVKDFTAGFRKKFYNEPAELSYAWQGYDIAYFFISGLAMHGRRFLSHPEIHNPDLLQTRFDFRRKTRNDGFENQCLFLIRYTNDYEIKLISEYEYLQEW